MAYDTVSILDATEQPVKIAVQTVETDEFVQAVGIDQAGSAVGSGNPLHVQGAVLTTIAALLGGTAASQIWKSFAATTAQTGAAMWTPASGKKVAIDHIAAFIGGTTGGTVTFWFGGTADTAYSAGTDQVVVGPWEVAPSATVKPFLLLQPRSPMIAATADHVLRVTTSAGITISAEAYGYETD